MNEDGGSRSVFLFTFHISLFTQRDLAMSLACFKAYDVRGKVPDDLDDSLAYNIGLAYAAFVRPSSVAIGRDVRSSSQAIAGALARGLQFGGDSPRLNPTGEGYVAKSIHVKR